MYDDDNKKNYTFYNYPYDSISYIFLHYINVKKKL